MQSFAFALISLALVALLFVCMGVPLMRRRVGPNGLFGLRTGATFSDEYVWYEANARTGRDFVALGAVLLVLILGALLLRGIEEETVVLGLVGVMLAGVFALAVRGIRHANRLLAQRRETAERTP